MNPHTGPSADTCTAHAIVWLEVCTEPTKELRPGGRAINHPPTVTTVK